MFPLLYLLPHHAYFIIWAWLFLILFQHKCFCYEYNRGNKIQDNFSCAQGEDIFTTEFICNNGDTIICFFPPISRYASSSNYFKMDKLKMVPLSFLFFLTDSYYGGYEGYGNGEWPRGCTDGWKRSSIQCPAFAIYWGNPFFLLYTQFLPLLLTTIVVIFPSLAFLFFTRYSTLVKFSHTHWMTY